ncbi:MAG: hypothetical protein KDB36_04310 [Acidimicrobiales bacterium]|nr:hypothetical protein [Acidimicrobiales bacterium]
MTLLRNRAVAASRHPERLVLAAVVLALAGGTYVATGLDAIEALRAFPELPDAGREQLAVIVTMVLLVWIAAPFTTTARRDLTVRKFVLLPIGASPLASGLYVAGLVGVGPLLTVGLIGYTVSAYVYDVVGAVLVASVAACLVLVAVAIGRLIGLALDLLALAPRGRLVATLSAVPALLVAFAGFELMRAGSVDPALEAGIGSSGTAPPSWLAWLPSGWAAEGIVAGADGELGVALAACGGLLVVLAVLAWSMRALVARTLVTDDRSTDRAHARTGSPFDGFAARLPAGRVGAVAARTLRLFIRTPGRLSGWALFVGAFGLLFSVIAAVNLPEPWAPFAALALTFPLAIHRANEIGADAAGFWMDVVSPGDRGADVLGRDLAALLIDAPLLVGAVAVYTVVWRSWAMAVPALVIVAAGWCITAAVAHVVAVRLATAAGAATDSRRSAGSSTGGMLQPFVAEILAIVGLLPLVVAIVWPAVTADAWLWVAAPAAALYGAAVWFATFRWAAWWTGRHEAELVAMLSTS